jgi:PAS domain S-box-containing protein
MPQPPQTPGARADEAVHQSEERYRLLVESVRDYAIFLLDPAGHVATWNPGAERIKGYKPEEILGRHFSAFYPPEDRAAGKPERGLRTAAAEGRFEDEGWRLRKDGSRFWANVLITAVRGSGSALVGFVKVTRDLTERRRADEQALQLAREQAARREAEAGVQARDRFLSIASHELRTPLNSLQINLQLLLRAARDGSLHDRLAPRAPAILEACERQVKVFTRLVNDLLDISRIAAGRLELRLADVDLAAVVRDAVAHFGPELAQAGCPVTVDADAPAVGRWDRPRLEQVVMNLLSNALKYGRGKPVEVSVRADAESARLTVRDHGIGIEPEDRERIFTRFERAVTGHDYGGLGMGLYIVRQLAEALGGSVRVDSEPGAGAAFTVDLPRAGPPADGGEVAAGGPPPSSGAGP